MMRSLLMLLAFVLSCGPATAASPPIYLWLEPEWFDGVQGSFAYWVDSTKPAKPTGAWGIAGPGISAEWSQGGESEWNSIGATAEETRAVCQRDLYIPRSGKYRVWVRYVDHRNKTEPFTVSLQQSGKDAVGGELGMKPVVPTNDEYELYWGFSFGWGSVEGDLGAGPARLVLRIDKPGQAWRQVDAVLVTDDLAYTPIGREKPTFGYEAAFALQPEEAKAWRGSGQNLGVGASWKRPAMSGRDFSMWTGIGTDPKWWAKQNLASLSLYDIFFQFSPPADIADAFRKQFAGRRDIPVMSWPGLLPGVYMGETPDLSPGTPLRTWLERTRTPFYIMTNYSNPTYTNKTGPATYQALTGPLEKQFLGYIHGESIGGPAGMGGVDQAIQPQGDRRAHVDALGKRFLKQQAEAWSKVYKTPVPEAHWSKGISCLSVDSISLAHLFHEIGSKVVGYEIDATNVHVPMRIAFERGAARQYGQAWINYASGNFGDACNYFFQEHIKRGAPSWFHSKYAITDGVSIGWYRKLYYLNYLGGASAIYWEQSLANQYFLPGPGTHPVQLSPFGRATEDFQAFVDRVPDRGEPYTPIGVLLSYGHAYERVNNSCKMLNVFSESKADLELRELFNVFWYPAGVIEGQPARPEVSMPSGCYGNVFDILVDRPTRSRAIFDYPVLWAAGDVDLGGQWPAVLQDYVRRGGTLVLNIQAVKGLPPELLGLKPTGKVSVADTWSPPGGKAQAATPFEVAGVDLVGAKVLAWATPGVPLITRQQVGAGAVILTLVPRMLGQDERAHPALPFLMNGLTTDLLPVEVRLANGARPRGEIMYQLNRTKEGWLVALVNNRGVDKTPSGIARVDRRAFVDVVLHTALPVKAAIEQTEPRDLSIEKGKQGTGVRIRVPVGDVRVVQLLTQ